MSSQPQLVLNTYGVRVLYKAKGSHKLNFPTNHQGSSRRWENLDPPTNMEMTGYFKGNGSDTVSAKIRGGKHNDSDRYAGCCYIPQAPTRGGSPRFQIECPHPNNHNCPFTKDSNCLGIENWRGYKVVVWNTEDNCVYMELWEDQGNNNDRPANQWVRVMHHTDCNGNCGNIDSPLLKPKKSSNQATWRIDVSGTQAKWLSSVEIEPGVAAGTDTDPKTPVGGSIPKPEFPETTISKEWIDVWHMGQDAGESCTTSGNITPASLEDLWNVSGTSPAIYFDIFAGSNVYFGIQINAKTSRLWDTLPLQWNIPIFKQGNPTGNLKLLEYDIEPLKTQTGSAILERQIADNIDVASLSSSVETTLQIQDLTNTVKVKVNHIFVLNYAGGDNSNKIRVRQTDVDILDSNDTMVTYGPLPGLFWSGNRDCPWTIKGYKTGTG